MSSKQQKMFVFSDEYDLPIIDETLQKIYDEETDVPDNDNYVKYVLYLKAKDVTNWLNSLGCIGLFYFKNFRAQ